MTKRRVLLAGLAVASVVMVLSPDASAERVRQWIAPPECVLDAGLPTQYVLNEQECYDLLHPPLEPENPENPDGSTPPNPSDNDSKSTGRSKAYIPIVFLPQITDKTSQPLIDNKYRIVVDHGSKKHRDGSRGVIILAVFYALLGLVYLVRRHRTRDEEDY